MQVVKSKRDNFHKGKDNVNADDDGDESTT